MIIKTAYKIVIAQILFRLVMTLRGVLGLSHDVQVKRSGIQWQLDLREGIDLSIYLLGSFEPKTQRLYRRLIQPGYVVIDIGANSGSHTLPLARLVGETGKVIAYEPTRYAFEKIKRNVQLNPLLAGRITLNHQLLVSDEKQTMVESIYSSWPLVPDGKPLHDIHRGRLMETTGATAATLDQSVRDMGIGKIDFIKLDVDGNEYGVLMGGREILDRDRPAILMEMAPTYFAGKMNEMEGILSIIRELGYSISNANTLEKLPLTVQGLQELIPPGGSLNIIAHR